MLAARHAVHATHSTRRRSGVRSSFAESTLKSKNEHSTSASNGAYIRTIPS
jgi:hypothetical protein